MKTTHEIKSWLKKTFSLTVKGTTSSGKSKWQSFYIPCDRNGTLALTYSLPPFPEEFRKLCIRVVYPNSPTLHVQSSAGNIEKYSLAMLPHEWEQAILEWEQSHPTA